MKKQVTGLWLVGATFAAQAALQLPALFSDGMVLQRGEAVAVWGRAEPGIEVTVSFAGQARGTKTDKDGVFKVRLKKMKASTEPRILSVKTDSDQVKIENVLVGEVWLCSGQSNMQWPVRKSMNFEQEQIAADYPQIRMFHVEREHSQVPKVDCNGSWETCTPQSVGAFSATAYFFGRELFRELEIPIGLIHSSWGGTPIEAWIPMASLEKYPTVMKAKREKDNAARTYDPEAEEKRHAAEVKAWKVAVKASGKNPPSYPSRKWHPVESQRYPATLYNAMIHPLVPYTLRGAIWYQGEANAHSIEQAQLYYHLLENMTTEWRKDWNDDFSFYAVQLVNFMSAHSQPLQDTAWAHIRESFLRFHKEVPNAGMAVGIDVGEARDIHPGNKQAIGYRLARQALVKDYGFGYVAGGPIYDSMKMEGDRIIIAFKDVGSGLVKQDGEPLKWFAIAGADQRFVTAQAMIYGDKVVVSSTKVPSPVAVRYAWASNPEGCNLFNKEGFPASPFRTDSWVLNND